MPTRMHFIALIATGAVTIGLPIAHASLAISKQATKNVTCSSGTCSATAAKAILNVTDLQNMLAGGDVTLISGAVAQDIEIDTGVSWTSSHRLTLDSYRSISVNNPMTVAGMGAMTITTNDGGSGGDYRFFGKGHIESRAVVAHEEGADAILLGRAEFDPGERNLARELPSIAEQVLDEHG